MDIRQMKYYTEIVKQENISKAAEVLNIAQPPLSQLLKKLEVELGTTLIHRYRQKWELTETGRLLYEYAEHTLIQLEEMKRRIQEIEEGTAGSVRVGVSSACAHIFVRFMVNVTEQFPHIKVELVMGDSESLLKKLNEKEIDFALLLKPKYTEQYEMEVLKKKQAILIAPIRFTASLSVQPTLKEIAPLPFIMLGAMEGHSFHEHIVKAFAEQDLTPNITVECKDIPMIIELVKRGIGISIIPSMYDTSLYDEQVKVYDYSSFHFNVAPVKIKMQDASISKAAAQFWELLI